MINTDYAQEKLAAIARAPQQHQQHIRTNAYWRIASNAELFGADLDPCGTLTPQQYTAVEQHIRDAGML